MESLQLASACDTSCRIKSNINPRTQNVPSLTMTLKKSTRIRFLACFQVHDGFLSGNWICLCIHRLLTGEDSNEVIWIIASGSGPLKYHQQLCNLRRHIPPIACAPVPMEEDSLQHLAMAGLCAHSRGKEGETIVQTAPRHQDSKTPRRQETIVQQ